MAHLSTYRLLFIMAWLNRKVPLRLDNLKRRLDREWILDRELFYQGNHKRNFTMMRSKNNILAHPSKIMMLIFRLQLEFQQMRINVNFYDLTFSLKKTVSQESSILLTCFRSSNFKYELWWNQWANIRFWWLVQRRWYESWYSWWWWLRGSNEYKEKGIGRSKEKDLNAKQRSEKRHCQQA